MEDEYFVETGREISARIAEKIESEIYEYTSIFGAKPSYVLMSSEQKDLVSGYSTGIFEFKEISGFVGYHFKDMPVLTTNTIKRIDEIRVI